MSARLPISESQAKSLAYRWMDGFRAGASFAPIPPEMDSNADYQAGFAEGRKAYKAAKDKAQAVYCVTFDVMRPLSGTAEARGPK